MSLVRMKSRVLKEKLSLTFEKMRPHWAYKEFGLLGDSIVAFCGPFEIPPDEWIDLGNIVHGEVIPPGDMLHFVIEHFGSSLQEAVLRQFVLVSILEEKLLHRIDTDHRLVRLGDDIFDGENRLSITAAGITPVSVKLHLGVFLDDNVEERVRGLSAFAIAPLELADILILQYRAEMRRLSEKAWRSRPIT